MSDTNTTVTPANEFEAARKSLEALVVKHGMLTCVRALATVSSFGRGRPSADGVADRKEEREVKEMLGAIVKAKRYVRDR